MRVVFQPACQPMANAEAAGLTDELEEWLDAAADTWMIERGSAH
jgi:hypothetical protein